MNHTRTKEFFFYTDEAENELREQIAMKFGLLDDRKLQRREKRENRRLDILVTRPTEANPCINLITMGAGVIITMEGIRYTEYVITLPESWPMDFNAWKDERYYWPIRLLQDAADYTFYQGEQLDWFHSLDHCSAYAPNTALCACLFAIPARCLTTTLAGGDVVKFLQIVPLYRNELEFCHQGGSADLCDMLYEYYPGERFAEIDPQRPSFL